MCLHKSRPLFDFIYRAQPSSEMKRSGIELGTAFAKWRRAKKAVSYSFLIQNVHEILKYYPMVALVF